MDESATRLATVSLRVVKATKELTEHVMLGCEFTFSDLDVTHPRRFRPGVTTTTEYVVSGPNYMIRGFAEWAMGQEGVEVI